MAVTPLQLAALPAWLASKLAARAAGSSQGSKTTEPIQPKIPKGKQHLTLVSFAGTLRRRGAEFAVIFAALKAMNASQCIEPGTEEAIRKIAEGISKKPAGQTNWTYFDGFREENDIRGAQSQASKAAPEGAPSLSTDSPNLPARDWTEGLITGKKGKVLSVVANALTAFRHSPEVQGIWAFDSSALAIIARKTPPWEPERKAPFKWGDVDDVRAAAWLQHQGILVSPFTAAEAVRVVAHENQFHPIRDYLNALVWDGDGRIDNWLITYLGAMPSEYMAAVGSRWLIGGVARIYQPGCKNDSCLTLEGEQGTLKSTALGILGGSWFSDCMPELGSKDAQLQTRGIWVLELSELDSMTRGEVGRVKAYMTQAIDRYRPPYGRTAIDVPRECVFAGTSNHGVYLKDETGGRRFWPVKCGVIDIESLRRDRDQLWAEALVRYRDGRAWWLDRTPLVQCAAEEQEDRYEADPWDELIRPWIAGRESVSIAEVLASCIGKPASLWTQQDKNRVGRSLRVMRWERFKAGPRADREYRFRLKTWTRPDVDTDVDTGKS